MPDDNARIGRAWLALCFALAVHVADEAATGFLDVYNPTVAAIRDSAPWLPLPVFRFETWIAGLVVAILLLAALSMFVVRGAGWTRPLAYAFAILMLVNAIGHAVGTLFGRTVETVRFSRPMPGFYSSPLLAAASIYLLYRLSTRSTTRRPPRAVQ